MTAVVVALVLVFNPDGLLSIGDLEDRMEAGSDRIDSLEAIRDSLREEVGLLAGDSARIEQAVREILGWGRPGEFLVRFVAPEAADRYTPPRREIVH